LFGRERRGFQNFPTSQVVDLDGISPA